jgi:hypothetical protein
LRLVVLQIGVHYDYCRSSAAQHALHAGRGKAAPANSLNAPDAGISPRKFSNQVCGLVWRVVINHR